MIDIVPFTPEYADGVIALILSIQQDEFAIPITLDAQPDLRDIAGFYQHGRGGFWVALDDGVVVGSIGLLDIGGQQVALRKMFVHDAYRGARHAVARRLLAILLDHSRMHAVRDIFLGTTARFLAAHRFYEKHGFREIGRDELPGRFPLMTVDSKFYRRDAGAAFADEVCGEG